MYAKVRKKDSKIFLEILDENSKLNGLDDLTIVAVSVNDVRSIELHRRYFEVLRLFVFDCPELILCNLLQVSPKELKAIPKGVLEERVRKAIEIELGFVEDQELILNLDGEKVKVTRKVPKSIAYGKLTEEQFLELHREQKAWIFRELKDYGWGDKELKELFKDFYQ